MKKDQISARLRVLIEKDGPGWIAQGVDINYVAGGKTKDEAKKNFVVGLALTLQSNLEEHGSIDHFLKKQPSSEVRVRYLLSSSKNPDVQKMPPIHSSSQSKPLYSPSIEFFKTTYVAA